MSKTNKKLGFDLPPSALIGESKITINSNKEIIIEGLRNVLEYEQEKIKLNLGNKTLLILGTNLTINSLTINGVVITGIINSLEF